MSCVNYLIEMLQKAKAESSSRLDASAKPNSILQQNNDICFVIETVAFYKDATYSNDAPTQFNLE